MNELVEKMNELNDKQLALLLIVGYALLEYRQKHNNDKAK